MFQPARNFRSFNLVLSSSFSSTKQKFLFFFGAPGVGKGTFAQFLARDYGFNQIATGDEIRKILKSQEVPGFSKELVSQIRETVKAGKLVSDDVVVQIIKEKLLEEKSKNGVIFDGFPRTLSQLEKYEATLPTHLVINIFLNESILIEKAMGRRTCVGCGKSYNICNIHRDGYEMDPLLPKVKDQCDKCKDKLVIRDDDKENIIKDRLKEYNLKTAPLLEVYKKRGIVFDFEPKRGVKDYDNFLAQLKPYIEKI